MGTKCLAHMRSRDYSTRLQGRTGKEDRMRTSRSVSVVAMALLMAAAVGARQAPPPQRSRTATAGEQAGGQNNRTSRLGKGPWEFQTADYRIRVSTVIDGLDRPHGHGVPPGRQHADHGAPGPSQDRAKRRVGPSADLGRPGGAAQGLRRPSRRRAASPLRRKPLRVPLVFEATPRRRGRTDGARPWAATTAGRRWPTYRTSSSAAARVRGRNCSR